MSSPDTPLLSADHLITLAKSLAPSSTTFTSPSQVVVILLHSIHSALSFRLTKPTPREEGGGAAPNNALPEDWQQSNSLTYKHDQSSLEFVVSVVDLGDKLMIVGNAVDSSRSSSFEVLKTDYLSPTSSLSISNPLSVSDLSRSNNPFSTPRRLDDLVYLYRINVVEKLVPGLRKDGYTELSPPTTTTTGSASRDAGGTGNYLPDRGGPLGMYPERGGTTGTPLRPIGDDPLRIPGSGGRGFGGGTRPIGEVGRNDLEPLGGLGGTFGGGRGGLDHPGAGAGGMFMGPDHPLFRERFESGVRGGGGAVGGGNHDAPAGRWGGDGFLPPIGAPPGARFDPIGPENGPPGSSGPAFGLPHGTFGPGRAGGGGRGGRGGGGGTGPFGGRSVHPDLEQPGPFGRGGGSDYDAMFG